MKVSPSLANFEFGWLMEIPYIVESVGTSGRERIRRKWREGPDGWEEMGMPLLTSRPPDRRPRRVVQTAHA